MLCSVPCFLGGGFSRRRQRKGCNQGEHQHLNRLGHTEVLPKPAGRNFVAVTIARLAMDTLREVRRAIYAALVDSGRAPTPRDLAPTLGLSAGAVEDAYRALADAHVIVLQPGT